jgi:hypothetical protein
MLASGDDTTWFENKLERAVRIGWVVALRAEVIWCSHPHCPQPQGMESQRESPFPFTLGSLSLACSQPRLVYLPSWGGMSRSEEEGKGQWEAGTNMKANVCK